MPDSSASDSDDVVACSSGTEPSEESSLRGSNRLRRCILRSRTAAERKNITMTAKQKSPRDATCAARRRSASHSLLAGAEMHHH